MRLSYHVAVPTPMDSIGAYGYSFPIDFNLHLLLTDSTSILSTQGLCRVGELRRCNFRFMLRPDKLFMLHPSIFTSELSFTQSPVMNVWYSYMSKYPILMTELSSASLIILLATPAVFALCYGLLTCSHWHYLSFNTNALHTASILESLPALGICYIVFWLYYDRTFTCKHL